MLGMYADHQNTQVSKQSSRAVVLAQVNLIRSNLEGSINGTLQLVRGLVATLATEPDMSQERFNRLASGLFTGDNQLRNIAVAPNLVVSMVYPLSGNAKAIGLDYRTNDSQREAALRARDTKELVLAGPVDLVQGGQGFIGRFPVFTSEPNGEKRFWGIVSAAIDAQSLYRNSGLLDGNLPVHIAITGKDGLGATGSRFFGSVAVMEDDPVTADVLLPAGSWQIAAIPTGGWANAGTATWLFRVFVALAGALVVIPILIAGRLVEERHKHYRQSRRSERELRRVSQRLELALEASQIGVWEHNLVSHSLVWDERVDELFDKPQDGKVRGYDDWVSVIHPDDLERALRDFDYAIEKRDVYSSEYRLLLPSGELRYVRSRAVIVQDGSEQPRMIGAEWDVTADVLLRNDLERAKELAERRNVELETAKARIEHNALHDSLTGLPNRRYLDEVLEGFKATPGEGVALLHMDLDRFKQINDTLGHAAGDAMLVHAANVLRTNVRANDFVARIGGDEFVVFCATGGGSHQMAVLADRVIRQMWKPVLHDGHLCRFGVSVGIATETEEVADPRQLLVNADIALYRAKARGRNRFEFFTEALQDEIVVNKRLADEILNGIDKGEFRAHYQPQFDAVTLDIIGAEALVRWYHPEKGVLMPDVFLKIAEELNVMASIDRMVLEQALQQRKVWQAAGIDIPHLSVNVSARRLQDEELITSLRKLDIEPGVMSFELVESIFLDDNDELVTWNIEQIKELGIDIEIDDFGTGYASIVSLLKLKPRRLKIDRQLVSPIVGSPAQRRLVESIIEIGRTLGIEVVAEGVETMEHARLLKDLGCDILQGYAFGTAISGAALQEFVKARRWREAS
ncbi:EAL domain-containing protein [Mesorhizobium sp. NBSH29]|uniref:bifunctional diguanylate cyclase/phosphodiesterase n=1 Tax=Mesorhizobium sp. NBSH29 TaxID=2654249 RepID=UPI0018968423|nr:EAL domain-containing protein [Mesorhizobium sp. NBSH29]QPC88784.1 EAL domain-containing protein [Mesorhizobium sp. NBSH29]